MTLRSIILAFAVVVITGANAVAKQPEELIWDDMIPRLETPPAPSALPGTDGAIGGSEYDSEYDLEFEDPFADWDFNNPVEELDGKFVKLPGFVVPLESDEGGLLSEFLLVPYYGACIHTPAPPPNQIVYITVDEPFNLTSMYDAFWMIGTIRTENFNGMFADSVYTMKAEKIEKYEW